MHACCMWNQERAMCRSHRNVVGLPVIECNSNIASYQCGKQHDEPCPSHTKISGTHSSVETHSGLLDQGTCTTTCVCVNCHLTGCLSEALRLRATDGPL